MTRVSTYFCLSVNDFFLIMSVTLYRSENLGCHSKLIIHYSNCNTLPAFWFWSNIIWPLLLWGYFIPSDISDTSSVTTSPTTNTGPEKRPPLTFLMILMLLSPLHFLWPWYGVVSPMEYNHLEDFWDICCISISKHPPLLICSFTICGGNSFLSPSFLWVITFPLLLNIILVASLPPLPDSLLSVKSSVFWVPPKINAFFLT